MASLITLLAGIFQLIYGAVYKDWFSFAYGCVLIFSYEMMELRKAIRGEK